MNTEDQIRALHAAGASRTRAAKEIGVTKDILDAMVEAMGLDWPRRGRIGTVEIGGVTDTWEGHSKRLGVSVGALRWRKQQEKDLLVDGTCEPVTPEEVARFAQLRQLGVPAKDAAAQVGRPYPTLHKAAKRDIAGYGERVVQKVSPDEVYRFAMLCKSGRTTREAAVLLGRSRARLMAASKALGDPVIASMRHVVGEASNDAAQAAQDVA